MVEQITGVSLMRNSKKASVSQKTGKYIKKILVKVDIFLYFKFFYLIHSLTHSLTRYKTEGIGSP